MKRISITLMVVALLISTGCKNKSNESSQELQTQNEGPSEYIIALRKLNANPKDYLGADVELYGYFGCIQTMRLPSEERIYSKEDYLQFSFYLEDAGIDWQIFMKKEAADIVYTFNNNDPIIIWGKVDAIVLDEPTIKAIKIKKGW